MRHNKALALALTATPGARLWNRQVPEAFETLALRGTR
jgi:hypothetical protein